VAAKGSEVGWPQASPRDMDGLAPAIRDRPPDAGNLVFLHDLGTRLLAGPRALRGSL